MKVTLPQRDGTVCQNCGHPHHDGALWLEVRDYGVDAEPYHIKACDTCRCKKCTEAATKRLAKKS